jgi:hypothetical protein
VSDGINTQTIYAAGRNAARYVFAKRFGLNPTNPGITASRVDPSTVSLSPELLRANLNYARELIRLKHYQEARQLLQTINHPTAHRWLRQLDKPKYNPGQHLSDTQPISGRFQQTGEIEWLAPDWHLLEQTVPSAPVPRVTVRDHGGSGWVGKLATITLALSIVGMVLLLLIVAMSAR